MLDRIASFFSSIIDWFASCWSVFVNWISGLASYVWSWFQEIFVNLFVWVRGIVSPLLNWIVDSVPDLSNYWSSGDSLLGFADVAEAYCAVSVGLALFGLYLSFLAVFIAVKYVLKLIPTIG